MAVAMAVAFAVAGKGIVRLSTDLPEVRAAAFAQLVPAALLPVVALWAFAFDDVFFGAVRAVDLRNTVAVALAVFLVRLVPLQALVGNPGLSLAFLAFLAARGTGGRRVVALTRGMACPHREPAGAVRARRSRWVRCAVASRRGRARSLG